MSQFHAHSRRSFLKTIATGAALAPFVTRDMIARPPMNRLRHASVGASNMAWNDIRDFTSHKDVDFIAAADVDLSRTGNVRKSLPHARIYQDWREMLDKEGRNIDSINVSTPDHMHAPIAMSAMSLGKHVYVQKPMAHNISEVRSLMAMARWKRLVTQMGIQIHSVSHYRVAVLLIQAGAIGKVREVHSWVKKSWGDASPLPDRRDSVPESLDWDGWLGVAAERPFIGNEYYHPSNWRCRLDFGTGTLGDMGCHILDPVFGALKLDAPIAARSEGAGANAWNWPINSKVVYTFAGTRFTAEKTLPLTWYDGNQAPAAEIMKLIEGDALPSGGSIFAGTQGTLLLPHVSRPLLYPDAKFRDWKLPDVPGENHYHQFVDACLGRTKATTPFDYSGPLTEAVLVGTVASRFPQITLHWDSSKLSFDNADATRHVRRDYRPGWTPG